jgi:hypothetical protein
MDWHFADSSNVTAELQVKPVEGLSSAEVASRLSKHGPNDPDRRDLRPQKLAITLIVPLAVLGAREIEKTIRPTRR